MTTHQSAPALRFLFVAPRFHTNQVWVVRALLTAGHEVRYLTLYSAPTEDHSFVTPDVVELSPLGRALVARAARKRNWMTAMIRCAVPSVTRTWAYLRRVRPDVMVIRDPTTPFTLTCMVLGRLAGGKIIFYTLGGMTLPSRRREWIRAALLWVSRGAWISPLKKPGDDARVPHPRMFYLPYVAPTVPPGPPRAVRADNEPVRVLTVGKFFERKNHLLLVEALADDLRAGRAVLTLVGEATSEGHRAQLAKVRQAIADAALVGAVDVITNVPFERMPEVYRAADVFVLPARDEPAGIAILEALAYGLPVVCSTTAGLQSYIEEGENGYVFRCGDRASLREKIGLLVGDRVRLARMSARAAELAAERFSAAAYLRGMGRVLAVLGRFRPRRPPGGLARTSFPAAITGRVDD